MKHNSVKLFSVREDVKCLKCGNKGAITSYGNYYPNGVGELADEITFYEKYRTKPYLSRSGGFGGTIPSRCMNCGNEGLIDQDGLELYQQAFTTISIPLKVIDGGKNPITKEKEETEE